MDALPPSLQPQKADGRYFIALRPSARARRALEQRAGALARRFGGKPLLAHDLHLTTAFIGPAPISIETSLRLAVAGIPEPQTLSFERINAFGRRLLWTGPVECPDWLAAQVGLLRAALKARQIDFDQRPFIPHLTLVRGARPVTSEAIDLINRDFEPIPALGMRLAIGTSARALPSHRYRWVSSNRHANVIISRG